MDLSHDESTEQKRKTEVQITSLDSLDSQSNEDITLLLDGASSHRPIIAPELETQRRDAADTSRPLPERLEAYEDIMDSEIGDTTLVRARNIERDAGLRQLYLKFEGGHRHPLQADRPLRSQTAVNPDSIKCRVEMKRF
jgi:hypothetical protein